MSECTPGFAEVAKALGGIDCESVAPVVSVRDPFALANWTMPVVEALMIAGAILSLVHAVLWWRRRNDPTNLAVWAASVVYVLFLEPPLYFPDRFGLAGSLDLIFVHNVFSVQFLQDRLPLYILALYPALTYMAYTLVQRMGILERRHPLIGAACVAFVFHCFYEVFDNIGPQLQWWAWNTAAPTNSPWLGVVPLSSAVIFAAASPFGFTLLARLLIARRAAKGPVPPVSMALRVIGVGVLTSLVMIVFFLPYTLFTLGDKPSVTGQAIVLWVELGLFAVVTVSAFARAAREMPQGDRVMVAFAGAYLVVFAALWATVLTDVAVVNAVYAVVCAAVCLGLLALTARREPRSTLDHAV